MKIPASDVEYQNTGVSFFLNTHLSVLHSIHLYTYIFNDIIIKHRSQDGLTIYVLSI